MLFFLLAIIAFVVFAVIAGLVFVLIRGLVETPATNADEAVGNAFFDLVGIVGSAVLGGGAAVWVLWEQWPQGW